jgi:hypothetical protein
MRKERTAARFFPAQGIAELIRVDGHQQQIGFACKMACRCFPYLIGRGEMDEAITAPPDKSCR